ncbi:DUF4190 domain-containing protein [Bacillus sonorensis]|uniref:DUF4190 domain-containing protein n=1 Tax=Bacillus sonorensis TaxID=119858 RepID=UPI000496B216|nr:DUF4190 domain-containing protein [Bacillus sonorensis]MCF7617785.1 DUF4190 domain-containing protein [Bacillus sonorensis]MCY8025789.1 DUF4190 domain-containing protein [Bacillus sonorensis]MCY8087984.1 DUF4190 domain-containing protein [Bacillus sonorensis]MCY8404912.1 DUF4190 domain-containing protein [Bacillus sonorensis]MCY8561395.1 DUF4190 domain-containing protein [Bacillus sonorensis]
MEKERNVNDQNNDRYNNDIVDASLDRDDFLEETAAEVAPEPYRAENRNGEAGGNDAGAAGGRVTGYIALALSIISLFMLPVLLGIAGIIVGYIARRQGAAGLGAWAMGIGAVSLVLGIFIAPFF